MIQKLSAQTHEPQRVLLAFDKFKGALSAQRASSLVVEVLRRERPSWQLASVPFSDGGEGFCQLLTQAVRGELVSIEVERCLGQSARRLARATVGKLSGRALPVAVRKLIEAAVTDTVFVMDMASIDGLEQLAPTNRDPMGATTLGTGQLLRACAEAGADRIVLGLGGSATNDLGLGALGALGLDFEGAAGERVLEPSPQSWLGLRRLQGQVESLPPLYVACDVENPLLGLNGATHRYGPQKGLSAQQCLRVEAMAAEKASLLCDFLGVPRSRSAVPGAGAAGGLGFGLQVGLGAKLVSGFELVSLWLQLDQHLQWADVVLTGEGRFDGSSWSGKGPGALIAWALHEGKRSCVFAGRVEPAAAAKQPGIAYRSLSPLDWQLSRALAETPERLQRAVVDWLNDTSLGLWVPKA